MLRTSIRLEEIQYEYLRKVVHRNPGTEILVPVKEWGMDELVFYCMQENYDPSLRQLIIFIILSKNISFHSKNATSINDMLSSSAPEATMAIWLQELIKLYIASKKPAADIINSDTGIEQDKLNESTIPINGGNFREQLLDIVRQSVLSVISANKGTTNHTNKIANSSPLHFIVASTLTKRNRFFEALKTEKCIANNTDYDQFIRAFLIENDPNKDLSKNQKIKKINWVGSKRQLKYLIDHLIDESVLIGDKNQWLVAEQCFLYNKEPITKNVLRWTNKNKLPESKKNTLKGIVADLKKL